MSTSEAADFGAIKQALGLSEGFDAWGASWDAVQTLFEREGGDFLGEASVAEACRYLRMKPEVSDAYCAARRAFDERAPLKRLAWQARCLLSRGKELGIGKPGVWPELPGDLGDTGRLFYGLVVLAGLHDLHAAHHMKGVPDDVTVDTLSDLDRWTEEYRRRYGVWGFDKIQWLEGHFDCRIFHLGRLQFEMRTWDFDFSFFRNQYDQRVVAMTPDGALFRTDGQFDGANGQLDAEAWRSQFRMGHKIIRGNPVSPEGRAVREFVSLPTVEWELALKPGDPTLGVHIPEGDKLTPESCRDSFEHAVAFFSMYFPEHDYKVFDCDSWLLDAQHAAYLDATSNIVQFQRRFYLLPRPDTTAEQTLERVFGGRFTDLDCAPLETSLQRHIVSHMRNGGQWRNALGVIFPEDLARGAGHYRESVKDTPWRCHS